MKIATFVAIALMASPYFAFARDSVVLKAQLQGAIQRHLDRSAVGGALPYLNFETGEVEKLFPTEAHPLILTMGEIFVLCADLRTVDGEKREVDFYLMPVGERFKIIRTEIENRAPLQKMIRAGLTQRLN